MVRILSRMKRRLRPRPAPLIEELSAHEYARLSQASGEVGLPVVVNTGRESWLQRCWQCCKQRMHRE